ncbi:hypothetical protein [Candidatus Uabimicrobium sp. HlEnr_7]|uniref:hypothetical protein n=1 Tax=Candidatus Uabimicrobium helgolandensis TaxID=3095367 RepID=UPI0035592322
MRILTIITIFVSMPCFTQENDNNVLIKQGLEYLVSQQKADGSWHGNVGYKSYSGYFVTKKDCSHVGVTALAALALLEAKKLDYSKGIYTDKHLELAANFLLSTRNFYSKKISQNGTRMISHCLATQFLARYYIYSKRKDLYKPLRAALIYILYMRSFWNVSPLELERSIICRTQALFWCRHAGLRIIPEKQWQNLIDNILKTKNNNGSFGPKDYARVVSFLGKTAYGALGLLLNQEKPSQLFSTWAYLQNNYQKYRTDTIGTFRYFYQRWYLNEAAYLAGPTYFKLFFFQTQKELKQLQKNGHWHDEVSSVHATAYAIRTLLIPIKEPINFNFPLRDLTSLKQNNNTQKKPKPKPKIKPKTLLERQHVIYKKIQEIIISKSKLHKLLRRDILHIKRIIRNQTVFISEVNNGKLQQKQQLLVLCNKMIHDLKRRDLQGANKAQMSIIKLLKQKK